MLIPTNDKKNVWFDFFEIEKSGISSNASITNGEVTPFFLHEENWTHVDNIMIIADLAGQEVNINFWEDFIYGLKV